MLFDKSAVAHAQAKKTPVAVNDPRRSLLIRCPREVWERAGERTRRVSLGDVTAHGRVQE